MRRRRRNNGVWFPVIGTHPQEQDSLSGISFAIAVPVNGVNITGVLPLTFDYPQEGDTLDTATDVLSEIVGSEYILNRVVGKLFANYKGEHSSEITNQTAILFGAGIFVARAGDVDTGPNGANSPIGALATIDDDYGILKGTTIREPWAWRRVWMLGSGQPYPNKQGAVTTAFSGVQAYPPTTAGYGSLLDGPHVDCKSKRRIRQDERLWLALSARMWPLDQSAYPAGLSPVVEGYFDYRILGKLVKARNSSAF